MAASRDPAFSRRYDIANTIIRQKNLCPICHLPLCYGVPGPARLVDYKWAQLQKLMKSLIPTNMFFGTKPTDPNAQVCHLVGSTMVTEITRPRLFQTPVYVDDNFRPENGLYMFPAIRRVKAHNKLMTWNLDELLEHQEPRRLVHASEMLSVQGINYFMACSQCNMAHTGHNQLKFMFKEMFNVTDANYRIENFYALYTLMFDCMADNFVAIPPRIHITENRMVTWQIELWINYCALMFIAQQMKQKVNSKQKQMEAEEYMFTNVHTDMGICDFYMNQILAAILYVNFDIDVDFMMFHQNFLSILPHVVKKHGGFVTANIDYNSTWRFVFAKPLVDTELLGVREDLNAGNTGTFHMRSNHRYWYTEPNIRGQADKLCTSIQEFAKSWLEPIGRIICTQNMTARDFGFLPAPKHALALAIHNAFWSNCGADATQCLENVKFARGQQDQEWFIFHMMQSPSIGIVCTAFKGFYNGDYRHFVFRNFVLIAFRRIYAAYMLTDNNARLTDVFKKLAIGMTAFWDSLDPPVGAAALGGGAAGP
jgi:hypothetical protein